MSSTATATDVIVRRSPRPVVLDPKKQAFLDAYYNPMSDTYANVYQSALLVGYSESYARLMKSPTVNNKWISLENYNGGTEMTPQHIIGGIERIALKGLQEKDKLKALELLAKLQGLLVDKSIVGHVNIESALNDLK